MQLILTYLKLILRRNGTKTLCASALLSLCFLMITLFPIVKGSIDLFLYGEFLHLFLYFLQLLLLGASIIALLIYLWRSLQSAMYEFGIMRSLGATRKDIRWLILLQTSITGLITLAFGFFAGNFFSLLLLHLIIRASNYRLVTEIDTGTALLLLAAVSLAIALMGIRFYHKIIRRTSAALLLDDR